MEQIISIGNLYTETIFKLDNGGRIKLSVTLGTEYTSANQNTYYIFYVHKKDKGQKKWRNILYKSTRLDVQSLGILNDQQIYDAMFNHYEMINPIRHFANGSFNGVMENFIVNERSITGSHQHKLTV